MMFTHGLFEGKEGHYAIAKILKQTLPKKHIVR